MPGLFRGLVLAAKHLCKAKHRESGCELFLSFSSRVLYVVGDVHGGGEGVQH